MLNQSFVLEILVNEHRNDLLQGANACQAVRQMKKEQFVQASRLKRLGVFLNGLRIGAVRPVGDRVSLLTDEVFRSAQR